MTVSLPEERMLMGAAQGRGTSPLSLDPRDNELSRFKEQARKVMDEGEKFTSEDIHKILSRVVLGL